MSVRFVNIQPDRLLDGQLDARPGALHFWDYYTRRFAGTKSPPYIAPGLQEGTTPLAKRMGGKATRNFNNFRHPGTLTEADYRGTRTMIEGNFKLVVRGQKDGEPLRELYDLAADPAEKNDLAAQQPAVVDQLENKFRTWQKSVLLSLTGADYNP